MVRIVITLTLLTVSCVTGAAGVVVGQLHSCALTPTQGVRCSGDNRFGQLGDGSGVARLKMADVPGLESGMVSLATGAYHTCALGSSGELFCWGINDRGELGNGQQTNSPTPIAVSFNGAIAIDVAAGDYHTCAVVSTDAGDRSVMCWGYGNYGQLGTGSKSNATLPQTVALVGGAIPVAVVAGAQHSCAQTTTDVQCWGNNNYGQLGDGTNIEHLTPVVVQNGDSLLAHSLVAGAVHTCGLTASGASCWGGNFSGGLGVGDRLPRGTPTNVLGLDGLSTSQLGAGADHTCAATSSGVFCWGSGYLGQQGNGVLGDALDPHLVPGMPDGLMPVALGVGSSAIQQCASHGLGLALLSCWGNNNGGSFGIGSRGSRHKPTNVSGLSAMQQSIAAGNGFSCALDNTGAARCWGDNRFGQLGANEATTTNFEPLPVAVNSAQPYSHIVAGAYHACAISENDHRLYCWGRGGLGQLGTATTTDAISPQPVTLIGSGTEALAVAAGDYHTCAVTPSDLQCWGWNSKGQIGVGGANPSSKFLAPVVVTLANGGTAAVVAAGNQHTCAITTTGTVQCWGNNFDGQLGLPPNPWQDIPTAEVPLADGALAASISAGESHTCVVTTVGDVQCWGRGFDGRLGQGAYASAYLPQKVALWSADGSATKAKSVVAGATSTCAVTQGGAVQCWGYGTLGELGVDALGPFNTPQPVTLRDGALASDITLSAYHSCVISTDNRIQCWGDNTYGEIGNGEHGLWPTPTSPGAPLDILFADSFEALGLVEVN